MTMISKTVLEHLIDTVQALVSLERERCNDDVTGVMLADLTNTMDELQEMASAEQTLQCITGVAVEVSAESLKRADPMLKLGEKLGKELDALSGLIEGWEERAEFYEDQTEGTSTMLQINQVRAQDHRACAAQLRQRYNALVLRIGFIEDEWFEGWERKESVTQDLLALVSHDVPIGVLRMRSDSELRSAERWAADVHLEASDNIISNPAPYPDWLTDFRCGPGEEPTVREGEECAPCNGTGVLSSPAGKQLCDLCNGWGRKA